MLSSSKDQEEIVNKILRLENCVSNDEPKNYGRQQFVHIKMMHQEAMDKNSMKGNVVLKTNVLYTTENDKILRCYNCLLLWDR